MRVNSFVSDKIYLEADTGPDQEPVKFLAKVFTASVPRRMGDYACQSVFYSLQLEDVFFVYTVQKRFTIINSATNYSVSNRNCGIPVQMFANPSKFVHVVVAGFNYGVNMTDKAEILVKYDPKITSRWNGGDVFAENIYGKTLQ